MSWDKERIAQIQLPDGATLTRTNTVAQELAREFAKIPGVETMLSIVGFNVIRRIGICC